jgi:uncharacterized ferredoxin-like protein
LDDAAALLLVHLLEKNGLKARFAPKGGGSDSFVHQMIDMGDAKTVCLSYLDSANVNRARYILRRLRRRNPEAVAIIGFWGHESNKVQLADTVGANVVTRLEEALEALTTADRQASAATKPPELQPEAA